MQKKYIYALHKGFELLKVSEKFSIQTPILFLLL